MTKEILNSFMGVAAVPQTINKKQLEALHNYKVLICDRCSRPQMGSGLEVIKCLHCGKINRFINNNCLRGFLITTDDPLKASDHVANLSKICEEVRRTRDGKPLSEYFNKNK